MNLDIPVYCYENAAFTEERKNLASCRSGEYEGLKKKLADPHGNLILVLHISMKGQVLQLLVPETFWLHLM